jgi:hypothetical protein
VVVLRDVDFFTTDAISEGRRGRSPSASSGAVDSRSDSDRVVRFVWKAQVFYLDTKPNKLLLQVIIAVSEVTLRILQIGLTWPSILIDQGTINFECSDVIDANGRQGDRLTSTA